jgi:glycerol-3-phosphate dehydrogenase
MKRAQVGALRESVFDLAVIGGGINGVAIARDAAMRGLSTVLLERDDLASGTSAWSSRMIHGGLRYLEHGEIGLVRESLAERQRLLDLAPHLVTPLPTLLPIYKGARRGPYLIRAGMAMYDTLSLGKSLPNHHMLSAQKLTEQIPGIRQQGLRSGALYYDAQVTWAERLVIEIAESAWRHGAQIATRCRVLSMKAEAEQPSLLDVRDEVRGESFGVRARQIVNVAGPWVDDALRGLSGTRPEKKLIGGTRGSHIIVRRWPGAPSSAVYFESARDARPILIIPWNGLMMLGSTDERHIGDPGRATATPEEVQYLLDETNALLPNVDLTAADILYTYAGVRPLPRSDASSTGAITRRHIIHNHAPEIRGLRSIVGGKLTTHRSLAEEVVDDVAGDLGRKTKCITANAALPGAEGMPYAELLVVLADRLGAMGLDPQMGSRLADTWGTRALEILDLARSGNGAGGVIDGETPMLRAEAIFAVRDEAALSLTDVLMRRTMVGFGPTLAREQFGAVAAVLGDELGWDESERTRQLAEHERWLRRLAAPAV